MDAGDEIIIPEPFTLIIMDFQQHQGKCSSCISGIETGFALPPIEALKN